MGAEPQTQAGGAPLCFILMPFGKKSSPDGTSVDFDRVYNELIAPAVRDAQLEPIRADQETTGGIIHKAMFERLILCPFAIADLTQANANVYYELGVRHAFRPYTTVQIIVEGSRLPFDVQMQRTIPYKLDKDGVPDADAVSSTRDAIARFLFEARNEAKDSPIFQLLENLTPANVEHLKTDVFREQVQYSERAKGRLKEARAAGAEAVRQAEQALGNLTDCETGILIDLFLSYRATKAWDGMVALAEKMPKPVAQTVLVREQLAFALNRMGRSEDAEKILTDLITERGPSSETYGLLGRVYKDRWEKAVNDGQNIRARAYLKQAIDAYLKGFEADWRDAYPGINAVTLMEMPEPPDPRRQKILPVVQYAVERKIAAGKPDYWDYATMLELAVLAGDENEAVDWLGKALNAVREKWEPETTLRNLRLIRGRREKDGPVPAWMSDVEAELQSAMQ
jgi:tetratricopeptide (TPR) repeat protein